MASWSWVVVVAVVAAAAAAAMAVAHSWDLTTREAEGRIRIPGQWRLQSQVPSLSPHLSCLSYEMRCLILLLVFVLILYVIFRFNDCRMDTGVHPPVLCSLLIHWRAAHTAASTLPPSAMLSLPLLQQAASCWVLGQKVFCLGLFVV